MGIDSRILIRYAGEKPTQEQMTTWSWDMCSAIGADKFFICDGLPHDEYERVTNEWHAKFRSHALHNDYMSAKNRDKQQAIRNRIVADIGEFDFKERRYAIQLTRDWDDEPKFEGGKVYQQDGPDITAKDGEWLMEVSVWTRYYGVGYERGDLMTICAIAEWVEANIPNAEVWYGGDSSGAVAEPFGAKEREALKKHYYSAKGRDYYKGFGFMNQRTVHPAPCNLCVPGDPRFNQFGTGPNYVAVHCTGCGKSFISTDDGATWKEEEKK